MSEIDRGGVTAGDAPIVLAGAFRNRDGVEEDREVLTDEPSS